MYNDKFFSDRQIYTNDYKWFGYVIKLLFRPKSLIDFGCGNGLLIAPLAGLGVNVIGFESSESAKSYADKSIIDNIHIKDLTKLIYDAPQTDISVCIEVAEHVNEIFADILINNITNHSKTIIFSAAPPSQGGVGHINLKPWSYWETKFIANGYKSDLIMTQALKFLLSRKIKFCYWLPQNIRVLKKIN